VSSSNAGEVLIRQIFFVRRPKMTSKRASKSASESTVKTAIGAIQEGASDASEALKSVQETVGNIASGVVYRTFYVASFGVVFTGLLIGKVLPKSGPAANGLRDGAVAARHAMDEKPEAHKGKAKKAAELPDDAAISPA
jgi:hypothetical protein